MEDKREYTCINDGERRCLKYDKRMFTLEVIKTIFTPKMVLTVGFVIMMIISMMKGGV
jgi:hypothetical protein